MLETSRLCRALFGVLAAGCATPAAQDAGSSGVASQPVVIAPVRDDSGLAEEAKALLAQAETDVQRARAKRALWLKAWQDLLAARQAVASKDHGTAIRHAKRASELAQLGLEQLAYPAVK
jgi:hypothetical protein